MLFMACGGRTYQSEIVPAPFRGFVVVSLQLFLNAGSTIASGVNKAFSLSTNSSGWKTVTGVQFIWPSRELPLTSGGWRSVVR